MPLQAVCIIQKPSVNSNSSYNPDTPKLGSISVVLDWFDSLLWRNNVCKNIIDYRKKLVLQADVFAHHVISEQPWTFFLGDKAPLVSFARI